MPMKAKSVARTSVFRLGSTFLMSHLTAETRKGGRRTGETRADAAREDAAAARDLAAAAGDGFSGSQESTHIGTLASGTTTHADADSTQSPPPWDSHVAEMGERFS